MTKAKLLAQLFWHLPALSIYALECAIRLAYQYARVLIILRGRGVPPDWVRESKSRPKRTDAT